jgi:peptidoglycan hydrolase-like protein with peptidoglycan-binding domain
MRTFLIAIVIVMIVGAVGLVAVSVRWQRSAPPGELGPSEAQQNRAEEAAVRKSAPPQELGETQIRRFQEQLDTAGFPTGPEKGIITPQTEEALRGYQRSNGLPVTGALDEATQRSLSAGQAREPGKPTHGESLPGGTAPGGSPR